MKRILVVDDEPNIVELLRLYLEKEGFAVIAARDGDEALALHLRHDPDLVILDLMLPVIDGFEVCREIRRRGPTPILMLTARTDNIDAIVGLELGADDYVTKPFNPRALVARVKAILRAHCHAGIRCPPDRGRPAADRRASPRGPCRRATPRFPGRVLVAARAATLPDGRRAVALVVSDDGPGFPPGAVEHVFERSFRADPARTGPGSGLGLAIVRELARAHGGDATAENLAPRGARVSVVLPVVPATLAE